MNNMNPNSSHHSSALKSNAFNASVQDAILAEQTLLENFDKGFQDIILEIQLLIGLEQQMRPIRANDEPFDQLCSVRTKRICIISCLASAIDLLDDPQEDLPEWGAYERARRLEDSPATPEQIDLLRPKFAAVAAKFGCRAPVDAIADETDALRQKMLQRLANEEIP